MSKQYGLIIPNKGVKPVFGNLVARPSVFNEDSDSDTPVTTKPTGLTKQKKKDKLNQTKAIREDPTVFQYDEIFDEMDQKRKESKLSRKDLDKKPKYISKLLAAAERRKKENERRIERQVQKEREAEGEEFKDKESFVTTAYKQKLEEMKVLEEQEKREEYLESIGDVRKQGNLDGFYRHLYDQKVNYEDKKETEVKDTIKSEPCSGGETPLRKRKSSESDSSNSKNDESRIKPKHGAKKRKYRTRKESEEEQEIEENITVKKEHLPSNLDADSDFSIDSSDSENDEKENEAKKNGDSEEKTEQKGNVISDNAAITKLNEHKDKEHSEVKNEEEKKELVEEKPKKPKIDIWKKRTVGEVFDEALKRYFERKALKQAGNH